MAANAQILPFPSKAEDTITILRSSGPKLTKQWAADGSIKPFANALMFAPETRKVGSLADLQSVLSEIEEDSSACVVRGVLKPDWRKIQTDSLPEWNKGRDKPIAPTGDRIVRRGVLFDDAPHQWMMVDVDNFAMHIEESYERAILRYVQTLPAEFHEISCYWQLSASCGHPTKQGVLKAHLWYWLDRPITSAELKAWAAGLPPGTVDSSLYQTVQIHYTAAPDYEPGVTPPDITRSGAIDGLLGHSVSLVLTDEAIQRSKAPTKSKHDLIDPRTKPGIIGAFHRVYTLEEVLEEFLPGHFEWVTDTRLTWTGGSGTAEGVVVRADRLGLVGSHDSWPGGPNKAHNLWDLVRIFKFGHLDAPTGDALDDAINEDATRSNSQEAMMEWVKGLPEVNAEMCCSGSHMGTAMHLTTDQANADRILAKFGTKILVAHSRWHVWCGTHWKYDEGGAIQFALQLSRIIHDEANQWERKKTSSADEAESNAKIAKALRKWAASSESKKSIDAAIGLVKRQVIVDADKLDSDPFALNCLNGTVDLRTGSIKPHDPNDYITKLIKVEFDPSSKAPTWERVISEVTLEDQKQVRPIAEFLRRWFGYCSTASVSEQKFAVHWGSGSNGKSTIIGTIESILGEYAAVAAPGLMKRSKSDRHPTEFAALQSKRMVTAHESEEGAVLREDFIKTAAGSDRQSARYMRGDFFEFSPTHKLQLLTNHKPVIKGQDDGIWRKVMLIPYLAKFGAVVGEIDANSSAPATHKKDSDLPEKLKAEASGILAWIVSGAVEWHEAGLNPPDAVLEASKDYQAEQDRVQHFINEHCELGADKEATQSEIYKSYCSWTNCNGIHALSKSKLIERLESCVPGFRKSEPKRTNPQNGRRTTAYIVHGIAVVTYDF